MKQFIKVVGVVLFAFGIVNVQAQTDVVTKTKSFISFSGGVALPMGNFAANDTSKKSGFAKMGSHFAVEGAYYFHPNIGIGGMFSTSSFSVDTKTIGSQYLAAYNCDSASAKTSPYYTINFLVGPYFSLPINKLTIDLRILGGITTTFFSDVIGTVINKYQGPNEGSTSTFVQTASSANAFGFQAGLGLRYSVWEHLLLSLRGDYFYSKPNLTFDNINRGNTGRILTSYNEAITGVTTSLGVGYEF